MNKEEQNINNAENPKLGISDVSGSFSKLEIEDCWNACTRMKADKGHLLNKSTEFNNAYQMGFEDCFKWLKNYR